MNMIWIIEKRDLDRLIIKYLRDEGTLSGWKTSHFFRRSDRVKEKTVQNLESHNQMLLLKVSVRSENGKGKNPNDKLKTLIMSVKDKTNVDLENYFALSVGIFHVYSVYKYKM